MPMEILSTLETLTISSFAQSNPVARLQTTCCVGDALKLFYQEHILSCPIADTDHGSSVYGFLDLFDLLSFLLDLWDENQQAATDDIAKLGEKFLTHTVKDLIDRSDNDVYAAVIGEEQAQRLVRLFGLGVHRAAMLDLKGALTNIISQSDVVKYLNANLNLLGENENKTIKELDMVVTDKLVVATHDQTVISTFKLLASNLVSAVPIVDQNGVLSGTLSVSDLKLLKDDLSPLLGTISQYKAAEAIPSVVCSVDDTLGSVISMLASSNVHRVWVVDEQKKPISVISITNVCEFLSRFMPKEDE